MKLHFIKITFIALALFVSSSCRQQKKTQIIQVTTIKCSNDASLFNNINSKGLLYKDSLNIIHIKLKNQILKSSQELSDCQKLPFVFIREVIVNDSLKLLGDIVDINSFEKLSNTNMFFKDNNHVYVFQQNPATYPPFKVIDIKPSQAVIFRNDYIKDNENVCFLGIQISENASQFNYISNKEKLNLFADDKNIIWNWTKLKYTDFKELALSKRKHDSLQKIYFPKQ